MLTQRLKDSRDSERETVIFIFCFGIAILLGSLLVSQYLLFGLWCLEWKEDDIPNVGVNWEFIGLSDDAKAVSGVYIGRSGRDFCRGFIDVGSQFWTDVMINGIGYVFGAAWVWKNNWVHGFLPGLSHTNHKGTLSTRN